MLVLIYKNNLDHLLKYIFIYTIDPNDRIIFENDRK